MIARSSYENFIIAALINWNDVGRYYFLPEKKLHFIVLMNKNTMSHVWPVP